jgi:hypothetical protein
VHLPFSFPPSLLSAHTRSRSRLFSFCCCSFCTPLASISRPRRVFLTTHCPHSARYISAPTLMTSSHRRWLSRWRKKKKEKKTRKGEEEGTYQRCQRRQQVETPPLPHHFFREEKKKNTLHGALPKKKKKNRGIEKGIKEVDRSRMRAENLHLT